MANIIPMRIMMPIWAKQMENKREVELRKRGEL
jgi:hypothetical protein